LIYGEKRVPLYEYECQKCGKHFERIEKMDGPYLKKCPNCGGRVERLVSPPAIQFKGSGWYVTDYARSSRGAEKADGGGAAEKSESKAESKAQPKASTETKEKKKVGKEEK
jgi:putative FmdB family regulatory protein